VRRGLVRGGVCILGLATALLYFARQQTNPPGFYLDESSIAYNALTIARTGVDEHGQRLPLFFRAFGEYKNPVYIYALAGVFRFVPPSNLIARRLSAAAGFTAAALLGVLSVWMSKRRWIGVITFLAALFTPALFEISRLAFEVALFPLATVLFLMSSYIASKRERWSIALIASLTGSLVLVTYTYSIGRLLAGLFLIGLLLLLTRQRLPGFIATLCLSILLGVSPLLIFERHNPGALTSHFRFMTYLNNASVVDAVSGFEQHFADNLLPLGMALRGDPNPRHHVPGSGGSVLFMTFVLAAIGAIVAFRERDRWSLFLLYGTLASLVPASLTVDRYHTLRLAAYPVFLIALSTIALERIRSRTIMAGILIVGLLQATFFSVQFQRHGAARGDVFDAGARPTINYLLDRRERPIYVINLPIYASAFWYAAQRGVDRNAFVVLPPDGSPPPNSLFLTARPCEQCTLLTQSGYYRAYLTPPHGT